MSNYQFLSSSVPCSGGNTKRGARGARGLKLVTRGSGNTRIISLASRQYPHTHTGTEGTDLYGLYVMVTRDVTARGSG